MRGSARVAQKTNPAPRHPTNPQAAPPAPSSFLKSKLNLPTTPTISSSRRDDGPPSTRRHSLNPPSWCHHISLIRSGPADQPADASPILLFLLLRKYVVSSYNPSLQQKNFSVSSASFPAGRPLFFAAGGGDEEKLLPHYYYEDDFLLLLEEKQRRMFTPYADLTLSDSAAAANVDVSQESRLHAKATGRAAAPRSLLQSQSLAGSARIHPGHSAAHLTRPWRVKSSIILGLRFEKEEPRAVRRAL